MCVFNWWLAKKQKLKQNKKVVDKTASLKEQSTQDEENTAAWTNARKVRERAVAKFLIHEGGRARAADAKAKVFIAGFKAS